MSQNGGEECHEREQNARVQRHFSIRSMLCGTDIGCGPWIAPAIHGRFLQAPAVKKAGQILKVRPLARKLTFLTFARGDR